MAGEITFTGLSSNIDMNKIIDSLVTARRRSHVNPLEKWKTQWQTKLETISSIDSAVSSLYTIVRGMDRPNEFLAWSVASSNANVLTGTPTRDAIAGTYSVLINQLAKAEKEVHRGIQNGIQFHLGVADKSASLNDSGTDKTFIYRYGGTTRTITVNDGHTLEDLMDSINGDPGNPGVTAKIVASGGKDHLVLAETVPEGSKRIVINPNGDMTLDGSNNTTDLTSSTFQQTINASGSDKVFQFRYGNSAVITVTVPTGTTLQGLRDLINNDPFNPGVRATVLDDGGTGSGAMHLVLSGKDLGKDYAIVLNPGGASTLDGTSDTEDFTDRIGIFTETSTAQNSQIRVDGFPPSGYIERSTNQIHDVITGITLNLVGPGTATVTLSPEKKGIIEKVEGFKDAYNQIRSAIKKATSYDPNTRQPGTLLGNYAIQIIRTRLDSLLTSPPPGFRAPDDTYTNLQQLGFRTDVREGSETQGLLLLDTSILSNALDADPEGVADVFSAYLKGTSREPQIAFHSAFPFTRAGIYDVEVDLDPLSENYKKGRFRPGGGEWHPWVDLEGTSGNYILTGAPGYPEKGLALHITYGDGSLHTSEIRLKNGAITEISSELEDLLSTSGPMNTLEKSYNSIINNIDQRINGEEARLKKYEASLRQRFARLDGYISHMNSMSNYLTHYLAALSSKGP